MCAQCRWALEGPRCAQHPVHPGPQKGGTAVSLVLTRVPCNAVLSCQLTAQGPRQPGGATAPAARLTSQHCPRLFLLLESCPDGGRVHTGSSRVPSTGHEMLPGQQARGDASYPSRLRLTPSGSDRSLPPWCQAYSGTALQQTTHALQEKN